MDDVTIREAEADAVRAFSAREFDKLDTEPWRDARLTLAAERNGEIVGTVIAGCAGGVAHLGDLIVVAEMRNQGLGARLLDAFEAWARAQGAHKCTLNTDAALPAVRFYARHGWRTTYILDNHYQRRTFVMMTKNLEGSNEQ